MAENVENLKMEFKKKGRLFKPIKFFRVNDSTILCVYKGTFSRFDLLIRYRQKLRSGKWSRLRTPKHIHWTVDVLMKMQTYKKLTQEFIGFFLDVWHKTKPIRSERQRQSIDCESLLSLSKKEIQRFEKLSRKGEYSVRFLILLAKLLMLQEKTNRSDAYMFKNVLEGLKQGEDLFRILSAASFRGR